MSECTGRCNKKEDYQVLLSKKDLGESSQHKHYLWMAHWKKANSSAEPQNDKISNCSEDVNKGTSTKFMKSSVAERLAVGVIHDSASVQQAQQFNSNMWGVAHNVRKEMGPEGNGQCHESIERSMKQNDVNLVARAVVSETYSIGKLSELPLDFHKLGDDPDSDWSHFPMFEINRQFDKILNLKRRSALGPASLNVNMYSSHVMALSSQEHRIHSHQIADENVDICKPAGGIVPHLKNPIDLGTDPSGQKVKGHFSDTMSCSCSKDDDKPSNCLIDGQHTSHYFANSKHNLPYASSEKKSKHSRSNKNQVAVYKQQDDAGVMFCAPVLGREFQNEPINCSNNRKLDGVHEMFKSHGNVVSSSLIPYEQQHLKTHIMESAANLKDPYMLPVPIANTLTANSNGEQLAHGKEPTEKSTGSCKRKGPYLFETLTISSMSQSAYPKNSVSSGKSSGLGVCMYGTNIGSRLFGVHNQSSAKTETLYSDTLIMSKSSAGIASPSAQKDYSRPNEAKNEELAAPSLRGGSRYSIENGFGNVNRHHDVLSKTTVASKQSCMPGAGNTSLDIILFQMGRMRNQISSGIGQPPIGAEPSDRWLKRLQLNIPDHELPSPKRSKVGDSPPLGKASYLFGMPLSGDKDDAKMIDRFKGVQALDEGNKLQDNQAMPPVPAKSMNRWVGRWCQGGIPVFREGPGQRRQGTKLDRASEEIGGQFPSIAAMAMMGRAMNKLGPCEQQRKGPFVVWKI